MYKVAIGKLKFMFRIIVQINFVMLQIYLLIFVGGGLGSVLRHFSNQQISILIPSKIAMGIVFVNIVGCFLIGLITALSLKFSLDKKIVVFFVSGFLGGFTTFSTFGKDSFELLSSGDIGLAITNIVMQISFGLIAVGIGFTIVR